MGIREFDDIKAMRMNILNNVRNAIAKRYPMENDRYILAVDDLKYDKEDMESLKRQKELLMQNRSLVRRLHGTWKLIDKTTGKVVDSKPGVIARVPDMTHRGTFIRNGNEYSVINQMRLKPGVYTRRKESGELEAHFNVIPGTGKAFRVHMEPETGVFKMQLGQSHVPLYPILKSQGVSDETMRKSWGQDLFNANIQKQDPRAVQKAYDRMVSKKTPGEKPEEGLRNAFSAIEMDPDIVDNNLGKWFD